MPGKAHQLGDPFDRIAVGEVQAVLGRADGGVAAFQNSNIQGLFVAEIVIEHALVDARAAGDVVDPGPSVTSLGELLDRRREDRGTGGLRIAVVTPAYWTAAGFHGAYLTTSPGVCPHHRATVDSLVLLCL